MVNMEAITQYISEVFEQLLLFRGTARGNHHDGWKMMNFMYRAWFTVIDTTDLSY